MSSRGACCASATSACAKPCAASRGWTPAERHALRIDVKRLRYAMEGLGPLLAPHRAAHYRAAVVDLQDALGTANDATAAQGLLHALGPPAAFAACAGRLLAARARGDTGELGRLAHRLAAHAPKFE